MQVLYFEVQKQVNTVWSWQVVIFRLRARKAKVSDVTKELSQNHFPRCQTDGPESQIARTPVEWKGENKTGNTLQSVLVNLVRGKKPQASKVYQNIWSDTTFPTLLSHTLANKHIILRLNFTWMWFYVLGSEIGMVILSAERQEKNGLWKGEG